MNAIFPPPKRLGLTSDGRDRKRPQMSTSYLYNVVVTVSFVVGMFTNQFIATASFQRMFVQKFVQDQAISDSNQIVNIQHHRGRDPTLSRKAAVKSEKDPDGTFTGSRIISRSMGMDVYENVCIEEAPDDGHPSSKRQKIRINAYTANETDLPKPFQPGDSLIKTACGFPLENYYKDLQRASIIYEEETLWTFTMYNNPGHCMNDLALNLALDFYDNADTATTSSSMKEHKSPFYPNYLASHFWKFQTKQPTSWCYNLLEAAGFLDLDTFRTIPKPPTGNNNLACFRRLVVPTISLFRGVGRASPLVDVPNEYPSEALELLRENVARALKLSTDSWPKQDQDETADKQVMLHIRAQKQRRKILNAKALKDFLETNYRVNITLMQEDWLTLTFEEQAKVYNSWQYVLTVHGAHQANSLFMRPNTKMIEFFCASRGLKNIFPKPNISEASPKTTYTQWYGSTGVPWFTQWTRKLRIEHFTGPQYCEGVNNSPSFLADSNDFNLELERQIPLIVTRFGLVPR